MDPARRRAFAVLAAIIAGAVGCGSPSTLVERFPEAASHIGVDGVPLSAIECPSDDFMIGGLGGPGASGDWPSPEAAADDTIATYSINTAGRRISFNHDESIALVSYTAADGTPVADVRVQRLGEGWFTSGIQGCRLP